MTDTTRKPVEIARSCELAASAHYAATNSATGALLREAATALRDSLAREAAMREALDGTLACLRHTYDRLIDLPEFDTLRHTINAEIRALRAATEQAT